MCAHVVTTLRYRTDPHSKFDLNVETGSAPQKDRKRFMNHIPEVSEERRADITSSSGICHIVGGDLGPPVQAGALVIRTFADTKGANRQDFLLTCLLRSGPEDEEGHARLQSSYAVS